MIPNVAFIKSISVFPIKIADYLLMTVTVAVTKQYNTIHVYAYVEDCHICSGIFNKPVNAGMDNAGKFEKWHL